MIKLTKNEIRYLMKNERSKLMRCDLIIKDNLRYAEESNNPQYHTSCLGEVERQRTQRQFITKIIQKLLTLHTTAKE